MYLRVLQGGVIVLSSGVTELILSAGRRLVSTSARDGPARGPRPDEGGRSAPRGTAPSGLPPAAVRADALGPHPPEHVYEPDACGLLCDDAACSRGTCRKPGAARVGLVDGSEGMIDASGLPGAMIHEASGPPSRRGDGHPALARNRCAQDNVAVAVMDHPAHGIAGVELGA